VHPGRLEEAAVVVAPQEREALLVEDQGVARRLGELQHVVGEPGHPGAQGWLLVLL
jgi:hypothetical protein